MERASDDWWASFFSGAAVEVWRRVASPEWTRSEVDLVEKLCRLSPGAAVLDAPCGHGRHSIELAGRGYRPTGVDFSEEEIAEARRRAGEKSPAVFLRRDMRQLELESEFDAAISLGNSFAYFNDEGNAAFLRGMARALRPGGRLLLQTGAVAECVFPRLDEREFYEVGDLIFLADREFDPRTGRLEIRYGFSREGKTEWRRAFSRVYTASELCRLLEEQGFADLELFGPTASEAFKLGAPVLHVAALRR